jgi:hypothetical protein
MRLLGGFDAAKFYQASAFSLSLSLSLSLFLSFFGNAPSSTWKEAFLKRLTPDAVSPREKSDAQ